jgi:hypothetical protein
MRHLVVREKELKKKKNENLFDAESHLGHANVFFFAE